MPEKIEIQFALQVDGRWYGEAIGRAGFVACGCAWREMKSKVEDLAGQMHPERKVAS
jgi:hypothetical protein